MENTNQRIRLAREQKGLTQEELGKLCKTTKQTIYKYENGIITNIPMNRLIRIADVLSVTPQYLIGWDEKTSVVDEAPCGNLYSLPFMRKIPVLGTIACGTPILARQNLDGTTEVPDTIHADFALLCKGNSMINARIFDGDIVYIRQQDTVNNGEIAAVLVDDEATLKRVHLFSDHIVLSPENPQYRPLVYWENEMNEVRILGKAVAFTSSVL